MFRPIWLKALKFFKFKTGSAHHRPRHAKGLLFCAAALLVLSAALTNLAWAAPDTNVYGNRVSSGDNDPIYLIDLNTGGLTTVASSLFPSAALARSPVSGLLYYTQYNVTDSQVATWNPDTGVHTVIGNLGAGVGALARLGFRANGVLYGVDNSCNLFTINTTTGVAAMVGPITSVQCDSGDIAFGTDDVMYYVAGGADDTLIWTINLGTLVGTQVHDVQTEQSIAGLAFAYAGAPYSVRTLLLQYSPTWAETTIGTFPIGVRLADAASSPIYADLSLSKIVDDATPDVGNNVVFTLTVTNAGPVNATGVIVTDLLPSGYTYVSDDGGGAYDDATGIWTVGAVATGVPEVLNITATVLAAGVYDNGAEITAAGQFDTDSTPDNDVIAEDDQVLTTVTPNIPCPGAVVTNTTDSATGGSLRACILWANGNAGADSISFSIPGGGPHTIQPTSPLPVITDTITIDGSTEPDFVSDPIVEIDGASAGAGARGLEIAAGGPNSTIRALVINNFDDRGVFVNSTGNTIVGNWIGLDADGVTAAPNNFTGLFVSDTATGNTIGGIVDADRNVVSGNSSQGMHIRSDNNVIRGNYIGTDVFGAVAGVGNTSQGIRVHLAADNNMIGGPTAAEANIIAGNANDGIDHRSTGTANSFLRNSIYSNGSIGIDLSNDGLGDPTGADGVTANDAGDPDPGSNNLLNFPVITAAAESGGTLDVDFDLDVPAGNYRIEFFTNPSGADPSGNGEGEVYQSNTTIAHGGTGVESFSHSFAGVAGDILTVTATLDLGGSNYGATSEFGAAFTAVAAVVCPGAVVTDTGDAATGGSLRACIIWANGNAGADTISFNIPGGGPHTIQPTSAYPNITDTITIDGTTEPDFVSDPIVELDGTFAGAGARGLWINGAADGSTIRGLIINNYDNRGIQVNDPNVTIVGNWIGLDTDGATAAANNSQGIFLTNGGDNVTIGGTVDADRNVISGNSSQGIASRGNDVVISGNYIGTDSTGAILVGNGSHGVRIRNDADDNTVGGTTAAHANVIADNAGDGISHDSTGTANSFLRNLIYGNSGLGIDLSNDGVTENDAGDIDPAIPPAANNLLNFPVITAATEIGGTLNVDYDLDVIPAGNYRIEFSTNPSGADASGNGEGEIFQSAVTIAHLGAGLESFSHSFAGTAGDIVTATATLELAGPDYAATSEFGDAFTAVLGGLVVNSTRDVSDNSAGDGACDTGALNTQGAAECTLRAAVEEANAYAGADTIEFDIPTTELGYSAAPLSYTISLGSAYPSLTEQVNIDGATQPDFPGTPIIVMDGTTAGAGAAGLTIDGVAAGSTIRGLVINNFDYRGIDVNAINNTIVGNWIGLNVDGVTAAGNVATGIFLTAGSNNTTVGGTVAADRNVVSANSLGIWLQGDDNLITGNYIGTDSSGAVGGVGNAGPGVRFGAGANGNTLGGTTAAEANIIADNAGNGIVAVGAGDENSFLRNSVYANGGLGIDLGNDGVSENDAGDPDPGANNLLNFPVITSAEETAGTLDVNFDLDVPAGNYRIEFFTNPSGADASGNGEGEVYQDAVTIAHGGAGVESFNHSFAGTAGDILTVTATDEVAGPAYTATSEFGDAFTAVLAAASLIAHWNFDEGTGQTVGDSSGNGNDGTRGNDSGVSGDDPTWQCVDGGYALAFDGTDDWVNAGDIDAIDGASKLSIAAWVKSDDISAHKTVIRKNGSSPMWQIRQAEGVGSGIRVSIGDQTPDGVTGDGLLSAGVWGHWTMVFDGAGATNDDRLKIYFDGVDQGPLTFANGPMPTSIPDAGAAVVQIGQHEFFTGIIDELRIYDGALSPGEVSALAATPPEECRSIAKRAFWLDGTPIPNGVDIPSGVQFKFMLYINNPGALVADVSLQDVLDPAFSYVPSSILYDNSVANCAADPCTALEETAIFTAVDSGTSGSDSVDGDVVSFTGSTLDAGNQNAGNLQLDILGNRVWAVLITVTML